MNKLTKEECTEAVKALALIRCLGKDQYEKEESAIIMLEQLINEHFELKEKVDSVQSLLGEVDMFELLEAITNYDRVNSNQPCFPIKDKFRIITDKDYDKLSPLLDNKPYDFEELEVNMWVWDEKEQWYRCMVLLFPPCKEYPKGSFKSLANSNETEFDFIEFEPNRFYPREVKE